MPTAINVVVGGASANSYITTDEAVTYHGDQLNAGKFLSADEDDQVRSLIASARELNLVRWKGQVVDDTQVLQWPRKNAEDPDNPNSQAGDAALGLFSETVIPTRIKDAQAELALEMLLLGTTRFTALPTDYDESISEVGPIKTEFVRQRDRRTSLGRFPRVMELIGPIIDPVASVRRVVRV